MKPAWRACCDDCARARAGTSVAESIDMTRQWKGAALALAFVAAFMISIAFHSVIAAVVVLLSAVTISYVVGIAWMRTSTHRVRPRHHHQIPR
jgi:hypothetical protein